MTLGAYALVFFVSLSGKISLTTEPINLSVFKKIHIVLRKGLDYVSIQLPPLVAKGAAV